MKTKKTAKALLSIALVMAMLLSMCIVGFTGVSAAGITLNYEFAYKNAGYAEGRISLENADGTYFLYWADDTKALDGYHEIAVISSDDIKPFEMGWGTAIPAGATKVIAIKSDTIPETKTVACADAVYDIPTDKQFKGGSKQYDFMALSDIHIQVDDSYWRLSKPHFANALEVAADRDVDFLTICGDMVNGYSYYNLSKEYPQYLEIIAKSNYNNPIYETNGNHEIKGDGNGSDTAQQQDHDIYKKYTGLNATTGAVQTATYYEKTINGDHYIFMTLEYSGAPNEKEEFSDAQLDWVEGLLKKYNNDGHKTFIYQHALFAGYGAGDNKLTPYYGGGLDTARTDVKRLMSIMEAYPEAIMLSGHSHIDFKYGYNFDNENGTTMYTVHIPSTSSTTHPNDNGSGLKAYDSTMYDNSSQGYLVDVYDDYVIFNGTDLAFDSVYPAYTYMVDYSGEELVKNELEEIVYDTVKVTVDVSNLTSNADKVICSVLDSSNVTADALVMTKNSDGTYSADVIEGYSKVYFTIETSNGALKTSAFDVANCKITLGYQTLTYAPTGSVTKNVNAHFWGGGGDGTVWPGYAMTLDSSGNYVAKIPASEYTGVVFNEGASPAAKTEDLDIAAYLTAGEADVYVNLDGDVTEPTTESEITQPTEKPTEAPTKPIETQPSEATTVATEPPEATTVATEPTETTIATEPAVDELAPIVIIEQTEDGYLAVEAYDASGADDAEYQFSVNGVVYQPYSEESAFIFNAPVDYKYTLEVSVKSADGTEHKTSVEFEIKNGEALLPEMPERPTVPATEPTEVITSTPDETTVPTTSTVPTTETTAPQVESLFGDADLNGKVNVKDATQIQKHTAKMLELEGVALTQADVTGDGKVNIKDATSIQKYVAKIIHFFPVEEGKAEIVAVGANATLMAEVKNVLSKEYQYASYDAYMALKKAYMNNVSDTELNKAYTDYKTMKGNNSIASLGKTLTIGDIDIGNTGTGTPVHLGGTNSGGNEGSPEGEITVYFSNTNNWSTVKAYLWGTSGNNTWPGQAMTDTGLSSSSGKKLYKITFDASKYKNIIFTNGSEQTVDIVLPANADGLVYHLSTKSGAKYTVGSYAYSDKYE